MDVLLDGLYGLYTKMMGEKQRQHMEAERLYSAAIKVVDMIVKEDDEADRSALLKPFITSTFFTSHPAPVTSKTETIEQSYNPEWNFKEKIFYILREKRKKMTAGEIALAIRGEEPNTKMSVEKSVTLTASDMGVKGDIECKKEGVRNYYWIKS
jgi:hypothetical protein